MKLYGITGGIGSGKSLVARIFQCLQIPVYFADARAKWLTDHDREIRKRVMKLLGDDVYNEYGMDRQLVASRVFGNQSLLNELNGIIHPAVGEDFALWIRKQDSPYILKEAALLFESGSFRQLDAVIHVSAPLELRIERTLKRDPHRSREEVVSIIQRQMDDDERLGRSQYEIINDGKTLVIPQVLHLHQEFIQD